MEVCPRPPAYRALVTRSIPYSLNKALFALHTFRRQLEPPVIENVAHSLAWSSYFFMPDGGLHLYDPVWRNVMG